MNSQGYDAYYYAILTGVFITICLWIIKLIIGEKVKISKTDEVMGVLAFSLGILSIPAGIVHHSSALAIYATIAISVSISLELLFSKDYSIIFSIIVYAVQLIAFWAFPSNSTIFGVDYLIPIVYILPTCALLYVSMKEKSWVDRVGTTFLASLMLIVSSLLLKEES